MNSRWGKNGWVYLLLIVAFGALLLNMFPQSKAPVTETSVGQIAAWINAGEVKTMELADNKITVHLVEQKNRSYTAQKEKGVGLTTLFVQLGVSPEKLGKVNIVVDKPSNYGNWLVVMTNLLPLLFVGVLFIFLMRQAQGANNQALSFGKSRARMLSGDKPTVTFDDVAGAEEAKQELREVVEFLREPQKFVALGARIPKGVLLVGLPGTGKTLMAKAVSGEAGVPFFSISGSEFVEMFVGVGASRVRDLFVQAKKNSPSIVFVDEIDAVGRQRGAGLGGSNDEREQTLNQILVEMDGFDTDTNVIVMAATNRPDILDPALLRPGRFDRRVVMDRPDIKGRRQILEIHSRGKPLAPDVDLEIVARSTPGFVGADLENLINEAAILAARRNKHQITMSELSEATERVSMGPERRSRVISPEERRIVAYHEAGHAMVAKFCKHADPVHKVSIIPRGLSGGYTSYLPENDQTLISRSKLRDLMAVALGGREAEAIVFGDITDGAVSDIKRVTQIARAMVTRYGMSDKLGPIVYGRREELIFLGREINEQRDYSNKTARKIDEEVASMIKAAQEQAFSILTKHRQKLDQVANLLLEKETIEAAEFHALFKDVPEANSTVPENVF